MAQIRCHECKQEIPDKAKTCPNCGAPRVKSPLVKFTYCYFIGGMVFVLLYWKFMDAAIAWFLAVNWLAAGLALPLIAYGSPRKGASDIAGVIYWLGIAWLTLLFVGGTALIWSNGIGVQELQWLLD